MKEVIQTQDLCRFYHPGRPDEVRAIIDVNVEIRKNEYVVFYGPSGCGKTTLLGLLGSLDLPTKGRIFLYGEDVTQFSDVALARIRRKTIGFVFQDFNLISQLTAWENVSVPLIPIGVTEGERHNKARNQLEELGLEKRVQHTPEELSGGEQQRVAIARALINAPEIIIADEPTSNIDHGSIERLLIILRRLQKQGKTIVVSSHDPIFHKEADFTYRMEAGRLLQTDHGRAKR